MRSHFLNPPEAGQMDRHVRYMPEVDGLRALAVGAVLVYHLNPAWLPGGYLGVDIFFVISGFLISSILLKGWENGTFSFKDFYLRRARRILPALLVVVAVTCSVAYLVLLPEDLNSATQACRGTLLYYPNYFFAQHTGYFTPRAEGNPFLHTWSLGVEEQFYLLFPLLGLFLFRRALFTQRYLAIFAVASFGLNCLLHRLEPNYAFFALETRAWQLATGAWLAVRSGQSVSPPLKNGDAWGLVLALPPMFFADNIWVPVNSALATLGAMLFIAACSEATSSGIRRFFGTSPMRFVGRISYSLYLVHWPMIVLSRAWWVELTANQHLLVGAGSVLLAVVLHYLVEDPIRGRKVLVSSPVFVATLVLGVGVLFMASEFVIRKHGVVDQSFANQFKAILPDPADFERAVMQISGTKKRPDADGNGLSGDRDTCFRIGSASAEPSLGLWGDSHALALCPELGRSLAGENMSCEVWAHGGNVPALNLRTNDDPFNEAAVQALSRQEIRYVIVAARWSKHIVGSTVGLGRAEQAGASSNLPGVHSASEARDAFRRGLDQAFLRLSGQQIVLMYPVPEVGYNVPALLYSRRRAGRDISSVGLREPVAYYPKRHELAKAMLQELQSSHHAQALHPEEFLIRNGELLISQDGQALYRDDDHLSCLGSRPVVAEIMRMLQDDVQPENVQQIGANPSHGETVERK
jgi:peptidoglycan/LPS O-acetylase OafA/YrhL